MGGVGLWYGDSQAVVAREVVPHGGIRGMNFDFRKGNMLLSTQPGLMEVGRAIIDCTNTGYQKISLIGDVEEVLVKHFVFQRFSKTPDAGLTLSIRAADNETDATNLILSGATGFNANVGTFGVIQKDLTFPQLRRLTDFYLKVSTANTTALSIEVVAMGVPKWAKNYAS